MIRREGGFEIVDHTADAAIRGWGPDLPELFRSMARGLMSLIAEPVEGSPPAEPGRSRVLHLEADTEAELLHDWLESLNSLHQIHREIYVEFDPRIEGTRLSAVVRGESLDPSRWSFGIEVKAVTWHDLTLERSEEGFAAYVLLDI